MEIQLTEEKEKEIEVIMDDIRKILSEKLPPKTSKKPYCKRCSYYELCWC